MAPGLLDSELDLDALIYPTPHGGKRFRPKVEKLGGKQQFPFLVDPNTGESLYESADIIDYLYERYGKRPAPPRLLRPLDVSSSVLAGIPSRLEDFYAVRRVTAREQEIIRLLLAGHRNKKIAAELFISENTVKTHVRHILEKLEASNRGEAVSKATQMGLIGGAESGEHRTP